MRIGDEVLIHGYVDEIRKDTVIIRNEGGYFGTVIDEIVKGISVRSCDEDCISRQMIDEIKELMTDINGDTVYAAKMSDIRQLPSVNPRELKTDVLDEVETELLANTEMHDDEDWYLRKEWVSEIIDKYKKQELRLIEKSDGTIEKIEPKPKTGHWIIMDDCEYFLAKCSECGRIEDSRKIKNYPYCHCGAKMED